MRFSFNIAFYEDLGLFEFFFDEAPESLGKVVVLITNVT